MPRQFTPDQKANALEILASNGGDIPQVHFQTGIPQRTLYRWRSELWQTWRRQAPPPPSPKPLPQFKDDLDALAFLRHKIMTELLNLANHYSESSAYTTPSQRVAFLSQLIDRLMKLDEHLKPYKPFRPERITFSGDCGLYLRTPGGYHGPYAPLELPHNWKTRYGAPTRLEIYWGDSTFSILPDEGEFIEQLLQPKEFSTEPCAMVEDLDDTQNYTWS